MTSDETKTCPDCAETVKAEAKVCRFCGYRFQGEDSGPTPLQVLTPRRHVLVRRLVPIILIFGIPAFFIVRHYHRTGGVSGQPFAVCTVSDSRSLSGPGRRRSD